MESSSWKTSSTTPYKFIATGKIKVSKTVFVAKLHVTCLKERGWGEGGSWLRPLLVSYTKFNSNICIKKKNSHVGVLFIQYMSLTVLLMVKIKLRIVCSFRIIFNITIRTVTSGKSPRCKSGFASAYCYPANIYLFKVNNRNTRKRCEICSKLIIKIPERRHWPLSGVFVLVFLMLTLNIFNTFSLMFLLLTLNK